jgi:AI-2 transport protein TqsA
MNEPTTTPPLRPDARGLPQLLRLLIAGAWLVVIAAGIKAVAPILTIFLLALFLALMLSPIMLFLIRRGAPATLAVALTLLIVFVGGAAVIALLGVSATQLSHRLPGYGQQLVVLRDQLFGLLQHLGLDTSTLTSLDLLDPAALLGPATALVGTLLADLGQTFFVLLITALLLVEVGILFRRLDQADRSQRSPLMRFGEMSADVQKYIGITALSGLAGSLVFAILLVALGVPFVTTWVVLYFLLGFIPEIGSFIAIAPVFLVTLLEHGIQRAIVLVVIYVVFNVLIGDVLKPRFMQKGFELSIVAIFAALVFWNWMLGPVGMLLAVPLTVTFRRLLQEFSVDVQRAVFD